MSLQGSQDARSTPMPPVRAFPSVPCVELYFPGSSAEECRTRMQRCLERGDGPAMLVGAPGIGKSLLMAVVARAVAEQQAVVSIASTQLCTRRALLQAILFGLGMPYQNRDEGELRLALVSRLNDPQASPAPVALLIDEAQSLPVRLLEELRILSNVQRGGESLVRILLAGSQALEERFASTELETFNQRLAARCYVAPLDYGETHQYVRAHVAAAGADPDRLFTAEALDSVYSASDGVPRLINQVCDRAIYMAVERGAGVVDHTLVQHAWSDLHQLPAPWHSPEPTLPAPESDVVEFGVLAGGGGDHAATEPFTAGDAVPQQPLPVVGDWNADAGLEAIATGAAPTEAAEEAATPDAAAGSGPVANDTPGDTAAAEPVAGGATGASATPAADAGVGQPISTEGEPGRDGDTHRHAASTETTPAAAELFGDGFDEEEVVIDRFASLEHVVSQSVPAVVNRHESDFVALVGRHVVDEPVAAPPASTTPPFEQEPSRQADAADTTAPAEPPALAEPATPAEGTPPAEAQAPVDPHVGPTACDVFPIHGQRNDEGCGCGSGGCNPTEASVGEDFGEGSACTIDTPPQAGDADADGEALHFEEDAESSILIIEADAAASPGEDRTVRRQEYRQLFANLRRS
ncbi:MAG: AAA family ATPase [Planctomycetota bacterium]